MAEAKEKSLVQALNIGLAAEAKKKPKAQDLSEEEVQKKVKDLNDHFKANPSLKAVYAHEDGRWYPSKARAILRFSVGMEEDEKYAPTEIKNPYYKAPAK